MRALMIFSALFFVGCGDVDPCAGNSDACLALFVNGQGVSAIDQIEIATISGYAPLSKLTPQPARRQTLPVAIAVRFAPPPAGTVLLSLAGLSGGSVVAEAKVQSTLAAGQHRRLDVMLIGGAKPVTSDMSGTTPGDGGVDGGGTTPLGAQCNGDGQCASGHCVDGVCCDSMCAGACQYCAAPGSLGTCGPSIAGSNWRNQCVADSVNPCGTNGVCDGNGNCQLRPAGTLCAARSCTNGTVTEAAACDGAGTCATPVTRACAPYVCTSDGSDCYATCTAGSTECAPLNVCTGASCGPAGNGASCNASLNGSDCVSGHCVDSVCCDLACDGLCEACNVTGNVGHCTNLPSGTTSTAECPQDDISTCGKDGTCDGSGACHLYAVGSVCVAGSCNGSGPYTYHAAQTCDGSGTCRSSSTVSCGNYNCTASIGCYAGCNSSIEVFQCKPSNGYCSTGFACGCTGGGTQACSCHCS